MFVVFFSCNGKKKQNLQKQDVKPLLSVVKEYGVAEKVDTLFLKEVEDWDDSSSRYKRQRSL